MPPKKKPAKKPVPKKPAPKKSTVARQAAPPPPPAPAPAPPAPAPQTPPRVVGSLGYITVNAGALPGRLVRDIMLSIDQPCTVRAALEAGNVEWGNRNEFRVNGQPAQLDDLIPDGATVVRLGKVKGN